MCGVMISFQQYLESRRKNASREQGALRRCRSQNPQTQQDDWSIKALQHSTSSKSTLPGGHSSGSLASSRATASAAAAIAAASAATAAALRSNSSFRDVVPLTCEASGGCGGKGGGAAALQPLALSEALPVAPRDTSSPAPSTGAHTPTSCAAAAASSIRLLSERSDASATSSEDAADSRPCLNSSSATAGEAGSLLRQLESLKQQQLLVRQLSRQQTPKPPQPPPAQQQGPFQLPQQQQHEEQPQPQQQQQLPPQQQQQKEEEDRQAWQPQDAGHLLDTLERRFASIQHSFKEVLGTHQATPPGSRPGGSSASGEADVVVTLDGGMASAGHHPAAAGRVSSTHPHRSVLVGVDSAELLGVPQAQCLSAALGAGSSDGPQRDQQRWQQQQQQQAAAAALRGSASAGGAQRVSSRLGSGARTPSRDNDAALASDNAPQPRALRPRPSIHQQQQQQWLFGARGSLGGLEGSAAAAAVAAAGVGVLGDEHNWASNALALAKQQAAELQQQNDALVRVLERERQQHARSRQMAQEAQLGFREAKAEWEVMLHTLRQQNVGVQAQLRRALAGGQHQEVMDAYDAALAAAAARVEQAQAAASDMASQLADMECELSLLRHAGRTSCVSLDDNASGGRADAAAVAVAAAGEARRSPEKQRAAAALAVAVPADGGGGGSRGVRALRKRQQSLEQQLARQQEVLQHLERDNIRLLRYQQQFEVAAGRLAAAAAAKAAAEGYAQEAGLRAAAAQGRADRLEMQVDDLTRRVSELQAERSGLQQQLMQARCAGTRSSSLGGAEQGAEQPQAPPLQLPPLPSPPPLQPQPQQPQLLGGSCVGAWQQQPKPDAAAGSQQAVRHSAPPALQQPRPLPQQQPSSPSPPQQQQQPQSLSPQLRPHQHPSSHDAHEEAPGPAPAAPHSAAEREAMTVVQRLSASLPEAPPAVQGQLAALMAAIQAGVQERRALAAQGQALFGMLMPPKA